MKKALLLFLLILVTGCTQTSQNETVSIKQTSDEEVTQEQADPIKKIPEHIVGHFKQGNYFLTHADYPNAIRKFKLATKLKPDFVQAHFNLGVAYLESNQIGQAIDEWITTITLDPDYAKAYLSLGYAYEKLSNNEKAVENYDKYLQLNPSDPKAQAISDKINNLRVNIFGEGIVGKITMTEKINSKTFEPTAAKNIFTDNIEVIYTTAEIGDAPQNTKIKAVWYYLGLKGEDILVNSDEKVITGPQQMVFAVRKPAQKPWPTGRYELRLYVDGKENLVVPYTIVKGGKPSDAEGQNT
jgi:tetratricopeptide (TPR) repeat protein